MPIVDDPAAVPGLPECRLAATDALPVASPPAPWACRVRALVRLPDARTPQFLSVRRPLPLAAIAFAHDLDTPVGAYHEILAGAVLAAGLVPPVQVPFIAVDSLACVHGGRVNWVLPKGIAAFAADVGPGSCRAGGRRTVLRGAGRPVSLRSSVQGATIGRRLRSGRHLGVVSERKTDVRAVVGPGADGSDR